MAGKNTKPAQGTQATANTNIKKGVNTMANTTTNTQATANTAQATAQGATKQATKPAKVNHLNTVVSTLTKAGGVTFTHNARNITVSNAKTGKKMFEVWRRAQAIRLYVPANLATVGKGLAGAYNMATGFNGYPQGTLSVYVPAGNIQQAITALVKAGLALPAPQPKASTKQAQGNAQQAQASTTATKPAGKQATTKQATK